MTTLIVKWRSQIKRLHSVVRAIEPWGILIAIFGIIFASYELSESIKERQREQLLREATLYSMASELLQRAREIERHFRETGNMDSAQIVDRTGYIRVLEIMVRSNISLGGINATDVRLDRAQLQEADLQGANLFGAVFFGADLSGSNLEDALLSDAFIGPSGPRSSSWKNRRYIFSEQANLSNVNFTRSIMKNTTIWGAELSGANFLDAEFDNTRLYFVDLTGTIYLTKHQLSKACGEHVTLPKGWKINPCR